MTEANPGDQGQGRGGGSEESEPTGPRVTDRRRLDPVTGAVRHPRPGPGDGPDVVGAQSAEADDDPETAVTAVPDEAVEVSVPDDIAGLLDGDDVHPDTTLAADLTRDLQRLQAEYVNYKKRVDRDRELHHHVAVSSVVEALLPAT